MATVRLLFKSPGASDWQEATATTIDGSYGSINPGSYLELVWDPVKDLRDVDGTVEILLRVDP